MTHKHDISEVFTRQWEHRGIQCGLAKHPSQETHNGYVQIPNGWMGDIKALEAHGSLGPIHNGITYCIISYFKTPIHKLLNKILGRRFRWARGLRCYRTGPDPGGWIGFDTWHLHDMERGGWTEDEVVPKVNLLAEQVADFSAAH